MIDVLGPEKRRRRTTQEKIAIVQQSFEPGMTVSLVARQHGVAASYFSGVSNTSNCLEGKNYGATWWYDSSHSSFFLSIAFRMVSSLRIQATSATFLAFPAASRRT